jgi:hypothetical protein
MSLKNNSIIIKGVKFKFTMATIEMYLTEHYPDGGDVFQFMQDSMPTNLEKYGNVLLAGYKVGAFQHAQSVEITKRWQLWDFLEELTDEEKVSIFNCLNNCISHRVDAVTQAAMEMMNEGKKVQKKK